VQFPSNTGKKVTEAVICRKIAWISSCISASVFSGGGNTASSPSLSTVSNVLGDTREDSLRWCDVLLIYSLPCGPALVQLVEYLDVELPSFDMFASFLACDDDHQFGYFAIDHPSVQLGHDLFDVGFDLIIVGN
jgi:hypothetical protein